MHTISSLFLAENNSLWLLIFFPCSFSRFCAVSCLGHFAGEHRDSFPREASPPRLSLGACKSSVLCRAPGLQAETAELASVTLISGAWNFILKVQGCCWWVVMAGAFCQLQLWSESRGEGNTSLSWLRFAEKSLVRTCVERKLWLTCESA